MTQNNIPKNYWSGQGRRIIVIPPQVLKKQRINAGLLSGMYLTDIGHYPNAQKHYTHRKKGSSENILIYCSKGEGWVTLNDQKHIVAEHTFFILPQNVAHEYGASSDNPWTIYWLKFGGDGLAGLNQLSFCKQSFLPQQFYHAEEAIRLFNEMYLILEQGYSNSYLAYVNMLMINFLTLFFFQHASVIKKETTNPHERIIQKVIKNMKLNLRKSLTITDLTDACGCSASHLSSIFKQSTGHSPIDYFNHLRIQKACQELHISHKLIKEIAIDLGYTDQYYFSRLFRKVMGISPNQYRQKNTLK